jgi:hypothetical protein
LSLNTVGLALSLNTVGLAWSLNTVWLALSLNTVGLALSLNAVGLALSLNTSNLVREKPCSQEKQKQNPCTQIYKVAKMRKYYANATCQGQVSLKYEYDLRDMKANTTKRIRDANTLMERNEWKGMPLTKKVGFGAHQD